MQNPESSSVTAATVKNIHIHNTPKNLPSSENEDEDNNGNYYWGNEIKEKLIAMELEAKKTNRVYITPKVLPPSESQGEPKNYRTIEGQTTVTLDNEQFAIPNKKYEIFSEVREKLLKPKWIKSAYSQTGAFLEGENYFEDSKGLNGYTNKKTIRVSNTRIRIVGEKIQYDFEDNEKIFYFIELTCSKCETPSMIEIAKENLRKIYDIAQKTHPEITYFSSGSANILEEYLSDIAIHDIDTRKICYSYLKTGWKKTAYRVEYKLGEDNFYKNWQIPDCTLKDHRKIFLDGLSFLNLSNEKMVINSMFLFAHVGFLKYWTQLADFDIAAVLFIRGTTGSFKTTVASEIFNIFQENKTQRYVQFNGSSWAGISKCLLAAQDNSLIIDDFSNTEGVNAKNSTTLMEKIIRAVGDERLSTKMSVGGKNLQNGKIRTSIVITGEDSPSLGLSSNLRMITVPVERGTFSKENLTIFQKKRDIMPMYFSLFIRFLTEYGNNYVEYVKNVIYSYRLDYSNKFSEPRFLEMAVLFHLTADVIYKFGAWCGVEMSSEYESFLTEIDNLIAYNENSIIVEKPEIKFLKALEAVLDKEANAVLAKNEIIFNENPILYVGFKEEETDTIWLDFDKARNLVANFWAKRGSAWLTTDRRIKEILDQNGLILKDSDGLLKRAKKGNRKRYLVIKIDVMAELLKGAI